MDNKNCYHSILASVNRNIDYYKAMITMSRTPCERAYYERLLYDERKRLNNCKYHCFHPINHEESQFNERTEPSENNLPRQRVFTLEELAQYDGSKGKPAYVAVNGIVYDVSLEATWGGGTHFSLYAGKDLTAQFNGCHGGNLEVLSNLPQVGTLKV